MFWVHSVQQMGGLILVTDTSKGGKNIQTPLAPILGSLGSVVICNGGLLKHPSAALRRQ